MELITIERATANAMEAVEQTKQSHLGRTKAWLSGRRTAWVLWLIRTEEKRQAGLPGRIADAKYRAQLEYAQKLAEIDSWGKIEKEKCKLELISLHNRIGVMRR
ncbi:MAG: hypothetical protein ACRC8G_03280 [Plesiomonas shigelloides]